MAAVRSDILRCGVRIVCEIMIAELKGMLLRRKKRMLLQMKQNNTQNGLTTNGRKSNSKKGLELLRKKQMMEPARKIGTRKVISDSRRKKAEKPKSGMLVPVDGLNVPHLASTSTNNDQGTEAILPDYPLGNIQIKQEVEDIDDITFEEHFEDLSFLPIKTELKDELLYDELLEGTVLDSSSCDTLEDGGLRKKPRLEDTNRLTQNVTSLIPEKQLQRIEKSMDAPGPCEKPYVCKSCFKRFSTFNDLKKHATMHERNIMKFYCNKCNLKFTSSIKLKEHLNRHAEKSLPRSNSSKLNTCNVCNRSYTNINLLNRHKLLHDLAKLSASKAIIRKYKEYSRNVNPLVNSMSGKSFKCKYCLKSYRLISELVRHAYVHPYPQRFAYPDFCTVNDRIELEDEGEGGSILRSILTV